MNAKEVAASFQQIKSKRKNWEEHWQEISDFVLPRRADVTTVRSKGDKRTENILMVQPCIVRSCYHHRYMGC